MMSNVLRKDLLVATRTVGTLAISAIRSFDYMHVKYIVPLKAPVICDMSHTRVTKIEIVRCR